MFLCPIYMQSGLAYTGSSGFEKPTLGIYIEWWRGIGRIGKAATKIKRHPAVFLCSKKKVCFLLKNDILNTCRLVSYPIIWHK